MVWQDWWTVSLELAGTVWTDFGSSEGEGRRGQLVVVSVVGWVTGFGLGFGWFGGRQTEW